MGFDKELHREHMRTVRTKDTKYELLLREYVREQGYFVEGDEEKSLSFRPDIVISNRRVAIFMHGCFWHRHAGCRFAYDVDSEKYPKWIDKFAANVERDARDLEQLRKLGWRSLVVWECALSAEKRRVVYLPQIREWLDGDKLSGEIPSKPPVGKAR